MKNLLFRKCAMPVACAFVLFLSSCSEENTVRLDIKQYQYGDNPEEEGFSYPGKYRQCNVLIRKE